MDKKSDTEKLEYFENLPEEIKQKHYDRLLAERTIKNKDFLWFNTFFVTVITAGLFFTNCFLGLAVSLLWVYSLCRQIDAISEIEGRINAVESKLNYPTGILICPDYSDSRLRKVSQCIKSRMEGGYSSMVIIAILFIIYFCLKVIQF